jgi:hypothetical protein
MTSGSNPALGVAEHDTDSGTGVGSGDGEVGWLEGEGCGLGAAVDGLGDGEAAARTNGPCGVHAAIARRATAIPGHKRRSIKARTRAAPFGYR